MWTSEQLAYLAGIIDGEGSISVELQRANGKGRRLDYYTLRMCVFNTNLDLIKWIVETFGGAYYHNTKYEGRKQCYTWKIFGDKLLDIVSACHPYFIVKKKHADIVMEFRKTVLGKTNWNIPKEVLEKRHALYTEAKKLNKIGDHIISPLLPVS